jgi:hypothetical protein
MPSNEAGAVAGLIFRRNRLYGRTKRILQVRGGDGETQPGGFINEITTLTTLCRRLHRTRIELSGFAQTLLNWLFGYEARHLSEKPTFYEQVRMVKSCFAFSGTILLEVPEWPKGLEKSGWRFER